MRDANPNDPNLRLAGSWRDNADVWTRAVRDGTIESRRRVTDAAIVDVVLSHCPSRVLDLGCGEGWLARALLARGIEVVGVDGSEPLVAAARAAGGGVFHHCDYDGLIRDPMSLGGGFDLVVANFALLQQDLAPLLAALRRLSVPGGGLVIQTVHPLTVGGDEGWREENFVQFEGRWRPMPWYFRTLDSWRSELRGAGYDVVGVREPAHPDTQAPVSLILEGAVQA
ncbi:MAG: class I SAM-dependent methyltransferase [Alloalcanivorax venustensis]|jgi:SAM-dependent methyltransferase|uniref:class I SAM-dependent methyltransferase n=1 Tax=Alloalcanivorax venustensis TaxID=172371 RepID=UPI0032993625